MYAFEYTNGWMMKIPMMKSQPSPGSQVVPTFWATVGGGIDGTPMLGHSLHGTLAPLTVDASAATTQKNDASHPTRDRQQAPSSWLVVNPEAINGANIRINYPFHHQICWVHHQRSWLMCYKQLVSHRNWVGFPFLPWCRSQVAPGWFPRPRGYQAGPGCYKGCPRRDKRLGTGTLGCEIQLWMQRPIYFNWFTWHLIDWRIIGLKSKKLRVGLKNY